DLAADPTVRDELDCLAHAGCHGFRLIETGHDDGQLHVDSIRRITVTLKPLAPGLAYIARARGGARSPAAPEVGGYGFEGNACGDMAVVHPADRREPPVRRRARPRACPARRGRAWLPLAILVQRLVQLRPGRRDADAEHDAPLRLPPLPVAAVSRSQLSSRDRVAAPNGAARRRDDLRTGQAPVRRARLDRRPGHPAGAL